MEKHIKTSFKRNQSQEKSRSLPKIEQPKGYFKIGHYFIGEMIGKGGFGVVHKAVELCSKIEVAVKIINVSVLSFKNQEHLKSEISILKAMDHPNIIKVYQILHDQEKIFIFMELVKGYELYQVIRSKGKLSEKSALKIFRQVCLAVQYIHSNGISHRDIKTENIMVDSNNNIKLIDFGLAKKEKSHPFFSTFCGSPSYTAPEMFHKPYYTGRKIDIWCLGVILFAMLEGRYPFGGKDLEVLERNESQAQSYFKSYQKRLKYSSQEVIQIYKKIFDHENQRISIQNLLCLPLIEGLEKRIQKIGSENISQLQKRKQKIIQKISEVLFIEQSQVQRSLRQEDEGKIAALFKILMMNWSEKKQLLLNQRKIRTTRKNDRRQERSLELKQKVCPQSDKRDQKDNLGKRIRDRRSIKSCKIKALGMQTMLGESTGNKLKIKTDLQSDEKASILSKALPRERGKGNSLNISQQLTSYLGLYKKKSIFLKAEDKKG